MVAVSQPISWEEGTCLFTHQKEWIEGLRRISPELSSYTNEQITDAIFSILGVEARSQDSLVSGQELIAADCDRFDFSFAADLLDAQLVEHFDLNYDIQPAQFNDEHLLKLWGMRTNPGANAENAWAENGDGEGVVVTVIDTGIDYTHPDLVDRMWVNPGEIAGNGIDDDGNGVIDDVYGANYYENNGDPNEANGTTHGTHCAGTIGATGNNGIGVSGVAPLVKLMAIRFLGPYGSTLGAIRSVNYMNRMKSVYGVNIVASSNSWGGGGYNSTLKDAIDTAGSLGIVFIAAAGNDNRDNDTYAQYPASYASDNIIAVASHTSSGSRSYFSNYGATTVDISAPGSSIYSTYPNNSYRYLSGTSMATPHVSGAVAVLRAAKPDLSVSETIALLYQHSTNLPNFSGGLTNPQSGLDVATALSNLTVNQPPLLGAISNQSFSASAGEATIVVSASDPDRYGEGAPGAVSSCAVAVQGTTSPEGYAFFESFSPFCASANCERDVYGQDQKRLYGMHGEIFELSDDDTIRRVDGGLSVEIGEFPGAFSDPSILTDPVGPVAPASADFSAECLVRDANTIEITFSWSQMFWGSAAIQASVTDIEGLDATRSFEVTVTSQPPVISEISHQSVSLATGATTVPFQVTDPDGDAVTCSASAAPVVTSPPHSSFYSTYLPRCVASDCSGPNGTKLLLGQAGEYLLVSSNDEVVRHANEQRTSLGSFLGAYNDITLLTAPVFPLETGAITASISNIGEIGVSFSTDRTGEATVTVTCSSRGGVATENFNVILTATPPVVSSLPNSKTYPGARLSIPVQIDNGEGITQLSLRKGADPSMRAAQLASGLFLSQYEPQYDDLLYAGAKWVRGGVSYLRLQPFIDSSGELHALVYADPEPILLALLPGEYYEDPWRLVNALPSPVVTPSFRLTESTVSIDIPSTYSFGTMAFDLSAQKGNYRLSQRFYVDVSNTPPTAEFTSIHTLGGATQSLAVPLTVRDPDGQPVRIALQSVKDIAQELAKLVETKSLIARNSDYDGPGYAVWSQREARWYFAIPSTESQNEVCELRGGSSDGTLYEIMPSSFCDDQNVLLDIASSSGNPNATLSSTGQDAYSIEISPNGSRIMRVTLTLFDGASYAFAHIFVMNNNRSPQIVKPDQALVAPGTEVEQSISVRDPDGDTLSYSLSAKSCNQKAYELQREYGLSFHRNCSLASSDCEQVGARKMLYSSRYFRAVFLFLRDDIVELSFESDGSSPFAELPVLYYHYIPALLAPTATSSSVQSSLVANSSDSVMIAIRAESNACITLSASDGDLESTESWMIAVSQAVNSSGIVMRDTDGDGLSDQYETRNGGDPFNPQIVQRGFTGTAIVPFSQREKSEVLFVAKNSGNEPASGMLTVFDSSGNTIKEMDISFDPQAEQRTVVFEERAQGDGPFQGWLKFVSSSQTLRPELMLIGDSADSEVRMIHSRTAFASLSNAPLYTSYYRQHLLLTDGHLSSVPAVCNGTCSARLRLVNVGSVAAEAQISVYDENGRRVLERYEIVESGQLRDISLTEELPLSFSGSITIETETRDVIAFAEESALSSGAFVYIQQFAALLGDLMNGIGVYEEIGERESGTISLLNTRVLRSLSVTVFIADENGFPLIQDEYVLGAKERRDIDLQKLFQGEHQALTVTITTDAPQSLLAFQHRALRDQYGLITFFSSAMADGADVEQVLAHWATLKKLALQEKKTGDIKDARIELLKIKRIPNKNRKRRFFVRIEDSAERPIAKIPFKVCFTKKSGGERCRRRRVFSDEAGRVGFKLHPRKLESLFLRAVDGGRVVRFAR
ncbi:hypothetical protein EBR25_01430 [bacterium]|nr:hypothetical protein [bacterium]